MADQRIQCSEEMVGAGHPTKQDTLNRLMLVEHENDGTHKSGNIHGLEPTDSPEFVTVKLSGLSDGVIPYNVDADTGLADGPTKTDVDDAVTKKHAAVTIDGTSPLSLSTQALSLKNDADAAITEVDTDTLADSDTKIPTSKAVKTYADGKIAKTTNITSLNETGIADGEIAVFNLSNKDIRTSNVLISTDGTLAGNADTNVPTEKAVKTYADLKLAKASNLSDVSNAATAFGNIKQAASTSATGVVELATVAEAVAGTDTSRAVTADGVAAAVAQAAASRGIEQAVLTSYAASGNTGLYIGDDAEIDFGTKDFSLLWRGSLPDWTPLNKSTLMRKSDGTNGWILDVIETTGIIKLTLNTTEYSSTVAPNVVDNTVHEIIVVVTRETATAAGSVVFYVDGKVLGSSVAITAGSPTTVDNAVSLYIHGSSATQTVGICHSVAAFNKALSATEAQNIFLNGIGPEYKTGSKTAIYTSDFSAGADSWGAVSGATVTGNTDSINGSNDWLKVERTSGTGYMYIQRESTCVSRKLHRAKATIYNDPSSTIGYFKFVHGGTAYISSVFAVPAGTEVTTPELDIMPTNISATSTILRIYPCNSSGSSVNLAEGTKYYVKNVVLYQVGAVFALEPEGIESSAWKDSSDNALDASYPASGSSLVRRTNTLSYTASAPLNMDSGDVSILNDASNTVHAVETTLTDDDLHIPTSGAVYAAMASAVTHPQQHAITSASDHTSAASEGYVLKADANGLPVSGTNTDDEIAAAVTASHTQDTDTDLGTLGTKNPPIDADKAIYRDSTASDALVTSTWTQVKAFLKTYFDTVYLTGDVFYGSNYASLAAALTAAEGGTLIIDSDFTTGTDEIPATVSVEVKYGAVITVSTGATLTISGPFKAGPYQVFTLAGTGTVTGLSEACPEWFGAAADGTTDDLDAINDALAALVSAKGKLYLTPGKTYGIQDGYIQVSNGVSEIDGNGATIKSLTSTSATGILLKGVHYGAAANVKYLTIHDLTIDLNGQSGVGIWGDCPSYCTFHNNKILNVKNTTSVHGILINAYTDSGESAYENKIIDNIIEMNGVGSSSYGIGLGAESATYVPTRTVVQGNTITRGYYGISLDGAYFSTVTGNFTTGNTRSISVQNSSCGNNISHNVLNNMTSSAVHLASSSSYNTISANTIYTITANSTTEGLLQAYVGCTYNVFSDNNIIASTLATAYHIYCAVESGGNVFKGNTLNGLASKAYIAIESDWYGSVTHTSHRATGLGSSYKDYASASMGYVRILNNTINNSSAVPAIFLSQITTDTKAYTLINIDISGNLVINNTASYQLEIYEMTETITQSILCDNNWTYSAVADDFELDRGNDYFRSCSGNSPAYVEGL